MTTEFRPTAEAAAATATARPAADPPRRRRVDGRPAPGLALVDRRSRRAGRLRRTVLTSLVCVLVVTLFAVGLVQAQLVQRQQRLDQLRTEIAETRAQHLRLSREVVLASSPEEIVRRATERGMIRAEDPVYLVGVRPVVSG